MSTEAYRSQKLQSWKEIANYLNRGVRTVQRWQAMGLPVRRLGDGPRSPVMADPNDLDRWLQAAQLHGFRVPQPAEHLVARGLLSESLQQSQQLRQRMSELRASARVSLDRLLSSMARVEKNCHIAPAHVIKDESLLSTRIRARSM